MTKKQLLEQFDIIANDHYSFNVPETLPALLTRLVDRVPDYGEIIPYAFLIGELKEEHLDNTLDLINHLRLLHKELPSVADIDLYVSSSGGNQDQGLAIQSCISWLRRKGRRVCAHVMGYAASSAFDIVQKCDYRAAEPFAMFMTHGEIPDDPRPEDLQASRKSDLSHFELLSKRTGISAKTYLKKISDGAGIYYTATEALSHGLIDKIAHIPEFNYTPSKMIRKKVPTE